MTQRLVVALALLAGCAGAQLRTQVATISGVIDKARQNGAERCAPVELAMAESHRDFASLELDEGDYYRARQELVVATDNAHAALRKSPADKCAQVSPGPGDKDGDGLLDDDDECPERPEDKDGYQDDDGCPELDNDADGHPDTVDDCPDEPEDSDGFQDDDGCPDLDNDADGLADSIDQCPDEAEDKDGIEDDDGCPDCDDDDDNVPECPEALDKCPGQPGTGEDGCPQKYQNVVVTKDRIELKQTIYFDTGKTTIRRVSYPLLDEVAQALRDHPDIKVRIEGHTDSRGKDRYNLRLSKGRAASVRQYLANRGIDEARMVSEGYGESRPIADNRTAAGRSQNRRVEFVITDR